jgi:aspartokinase/homoserine dehydrogenase 1
LPLIIPSSTFVEIIFPVESSFDLISLIKCQYELWFYKELRKVLAENQKNYLYETNVGAGLPLIDHKITASFR